MTTLMPDPLPQPSKSETRTMKPPTRDPHPIARDAIRRALAVVWGIALAMVMTTAGLAQEAGRVTPVPATELPEYVATLPEVTGQIAAGFTGLEADLNKVVQDYATCVAAGSRAAQTGAAATGTPGQASASEALNAKACRVEYDTQRIAHAQKVAEVGLKAEQDLMGLAAATRAEQARVDREQQDAEARAEAAARDLSKLRDGVPPGVTRLATVPSDAWSPTDRRLVGDFNRHVRGLIAAQQAAAAEATDLTLRSADLTALGVTLESWAVGIGEHARDQTLDIQARQNQIAAIERGADRLAMQDVTLGSMNTISGLIASLSRTDTALGIAPEAAPAGDLPAFEPLMFEGTGQDDLRSTLEALGVKLGEDL